MRIVGHTPVFPFDVTPADFALAEQAVRATARPRQRLSPGTAPSRTAVRVAARKLGVSQRTAAALLRERVREGKSVSVRTVRGLSPRTLRAPIRTAVSRGSLVLAGLLLVASVTGVERRERLRVVVRPGEDLARAYYAEVRAHIDRAVAAWQASGDLPTEGKHSPEISEISDLELELL